MLAVLILGAYWPGRFRDCWVTDDDFGTYSRDLPTPRPRDLRRRDTLKTLIRRGIRQLAATLPGSEIERKPIGGLHASRDPREASTRLRLPPSTVLEDWFLRFGLDRLDPAGREEFRAHAYGSIGSVVDDETIVDEAILHHLADYGDLDRAAARAAQVIARQPDNETRQALRLVLAKIELNRLEPDSASRALAVLRPMATDAGPVRSLAARLIQGRVHLAVVKALVDEEAWSSAFGSTEAHWHLQRARELIPVDDPSNRGDLRFAEALVEDMDSQYRAGGAWQDPEVSHLHAARSELAILAAFGAWRLAQRWDRIRDGLEFLVIYRSEVRKRRHALRASPPLVSWLAKVLEYFELTLPVDHPARWSLCIEILVVFLRLPQDTTANDLPLPAPDCFRLVRRCLATLEANQGPAIHDSAPHLYSSILEATWYREAADKEAGHGV